LWDDSVHTLVRDLHRQVEQLQHAQEKQAQGVLRSVGELRTVELRELREHIRSRATSFELRPILEAVRPTKDIEGGERPDESVHTVVRDLQRRIDEIQLGQQVQARDLVPLHASLQELVSAFNAGRAAPPPDSGGTADVRHQRSAGADMAEVLEEVRSSKADICERLKESSQAVRFAADLTPLYLEMHKYMALILESTRRGADMEPLQQAIERSTASVLQAVEASRPKKKKEKKHAPGEANAEGGAGLGASEKASSPAATRSARAAEHQERDSSSSSIGASRKPRGRQRPGA